MISDTQNRYNYFLNIEGELLNYEQVRSSVARCLGVNTAGLVPTSRHI
ncbi:MAG: DUF4172 domain-containing protein [Rikenellaceae bacterium]|nr:DUF4172 domain-containing protein [Rikenellaceae bacterium]